MFTGVGRHMWPRSDTFIAICSVTLRSASSMGVQGPEGGQAAKMRPLAPRGVLVPEWVLDAEDVERAAPTSSATIGSTPLLA